MGLSVFDITHDDLLDFFENASEFFVTLCNTQIIAYNALFERNFRPDPGAHEDVLAIVHPEDRPDVIARLHDARRGIAVRFESRCVRADARIRWIHWYAQTSTRTGHTYLAGRDMTDEHEMHDQLRRHAALLEQAHRELQQALRARILESRTDPLTGLLNRRAFELRAAEEASRSQRAGTSFGLALLDVDHFGPLNKRRGHPWGDAALAELARRIGASRRYHDVAGRWGGDEFVVLFPGATLEEARVASERIRASISETPFDLGSEPLAVEVSVGVAAGIDLPLAELVAAADRALLRAKRSGRGRVKTQREDAGAGQGAASGPIAPYSIPLARDGLAAINAASGRRSRRAPSGTRASRVRAPRRDGIPQATAE